MNTWRDKARPIIASIIAENPNLPEKELRRKLRAAFPWGPKEYHPYKIWLDEINVQLGKKVFRAKKVKAVEVKPLIDTPLFD